MAKIDLAAVAAAQLAGSFLYADPKEAAKLEKSGLLEINASLKDASGNVAVRATEKGLASVQSAASAPAAAPASAPAAAPASSKFVIAVGPALAKEKRTGNRPTIYPFDDFPAPDANGNTAKIFVPVTEKMPEPWKSLSSTVSGANRKFARIVGTKPGKNKNGAVIEKNIYEFDRKFAVVKGTEDGKEGAYIERVK